MTKKFGILGPKNTFTDLAAHKYAQEAHITLQERYFSTIMGLVKEVSNGRLNSGIVPYKNSIGGSVQETHEALKRYEVSVTTKIVLPIEHALVGLSKAKKVTLQPSFHIHRHSGSVINTSKKLPACASGRDAINHGRL